MRLPEFTAEACLYKESEEYIGVRSTAGTPGTGSVIPQCCYEQCFVLHGEKHCIHFCVPGACI
jgi:hypothetical protein